MSLVFALFLGAWSLTGLVLFLYLADGIFLDVGQKLHQKRRRRVLPDLSVLLFDSNEDAAAVHPRLTATKKTVLLDIIQGLALDVNGEAQERLQQLVRTCGLERLIRRRATSRRWRRRVQAAQLHYLVTHPDFDRARLLADRHALVRARAIETTTAEQAVEHVELLAKLLSDPSLSVRLSCKNALLRSGAAAIPPLLGLLSEGGSYVGEAMEVASDLPDARLIRALSAYASSKESRHREMAARALGGGTGVGAVVILTGLLSDTDADVRVSAITALRRLESLESAVAIGRSMGDESFKVRREAGNTLDELGAPGQMVLRQTLHSTDPFARDMARQVLDGSLSPSASLVAAALRNAVARNAAITTNRSLSRSAP